MKIRDKEIVHMDLEKIEGLVKIIENSSLTEFSIKDGDTKITMSKLTHPPVVTTGIAPAPVPATAQPTAVDPRSDRRYVLLCICTGRSGIRKSW